MPKKKRPANTPAAATAKPAGALKPSAPKPERMGLAPAERDPKPSAPKPSAPKPYAPQPAARRKRASGRQGPRSIAEEIHNAMRAQRPLVTLHDREGEIAGVAVAAPFQAVVNRWAYVLQSRRGWANRQATREAQSQHALEELLRLGLTEGQLQRASGGGRIEVRFHDADPHASAGQMYSVLCARRVPWEYLLSAATGALGRQQPISITRHLPGASVTQAAHVAPVSAARG